MPTENVKLRLEAWRDAERRRDALAPGSAEWLEAAAQVQSAEAVFHAELAQASARHAEVEFESRHPHWFARLERRTAGEVD